jgi:Polyketide cyclase / dehydrase and lipid transport
VLGLGTVETEASAAEVWSLLAEPARWHEWSPYVAGAEGLGGPEVEAGAVGAVILRGGVRIGAEILEVVPGRSWTWRVKGLEVRHEVEATPHGARLAMTSEGSGPFWSPVALGYRLPTALIARNVARVAKRR